MAAITEQFGRAETDRRFFLGMAVAIAVTVFGGFGLSLARPTTQFAAAPIQVHIHGAVFMLWILFYVLQNALVVRGSVATHRRLGMFGAALAAVMVGLGIATTVMALQQHRVPPFFPPGVFLVLDVGCVAIFGALVAAAIAMRNRGDWHKRLMLCGTIMVMSPALGRILPMPLLGPWGSWAVTGAMLIYLAVALAYDQTRRGKIHPAYAWGGAALLLNQVLIVALSFTPPVLKLATRLAA